MALVHDEPPRQGWLTRVLTTDFCPWANRFVYWLKEPIGWFVIAIAASLIVGYYANPVGWAIASALSGVIVVGMIWPLIAIWATRCELRPEMSAVHEGMECGMVFSVKNRIPLPVWGLAVEGYLDSEGDESLPAVALSHVPPICVADYSIPVRPELRGHYPIQKPKIACSFPFGIWTARRELIEIHPLTVWPRVYEIAGIPPLTGQVNAEFGDGQRGGRSGDFVGVRDFRRGDSPRHINWAQSARTDSLIVTERGGPQCVEIDLLVDTMIGRGQTRQSLTDRMRVAASLFCNLHQARIPTHVSVGRKSLRPASGRIGQQQALDLMADVPADGDDSELAKTLNPRSVTIIVAGSEMGNRTDTLISIIDPNASKRADGTTRHIRISGSMQLADQLAGLWQEVGNVPVPA